MGAWTGRRVRTALWQAAEEYTARGWEVVPGAYLVRRWSPRCDRHGDRRECRRARVSGGRRGCRRGRPPQRRGASTGGAPWPRAGRPGVLVCSCGRPACGAPGAHPVEPAWQERISRNAASGSTSVDTAALWWSHRPYTVLLPVGVTFEVFDAPCYVGNWALRMLKGTGSPVGPVCRTGAGRWLFFTAPSGQSFVELAGSHDVWHRTAGEYVVAPPSRLAGGGAVEWVCPPCDRNRRLAGADVVSRVLEEACVTLHAAPAHTAPSRPRYRLGVAHPR